MPIFKSDIPDVEIPTDLTVWQWLYESKYSSIRKYPESKLGGFLYQPTKERLNWRQVRDHATHLSTALVRKHGLRAGETVALFSRNSIWYPVMLQATSRIGAIVSGASPAYGIEEMVHALKSGNSKYLVTIPSSMEIASKAAELAGISKDRIFLLEGNLDGYATLQDLIALGKSYGSEGQTPAYRIPRGKHSHDICGFLSFSSGTTGLPKAVMISHYNMIAQCQQMEPVYEPTHRKALAVLPFFHITGLTHVMHLPIFLNMDVIILPAFTMPDMLQAIQEHRIRELLLVPPIYIRLVHDPIVDQYDMSSVRWFGSGSAPLSPEVQGQLEKKFPGTGLKQGWGMTESTGCITMHPPEIATWRYAHTVGKIVPNTEVRIVREDGSEVGVGEPGEILARGPQVAMGYLGRPDATAETFTHDDSGGGSGGGGSSSSGGSSGGSGSGGGSGGGVWLHTGDQGHINADGTIQITDRIKELIKVKGIGVAPAELEDALLGHPRVQDAAVIGIEDRYAGERPKAYVVAKADGNQSSIDSEQSLAGGGISGGQSESLVELGRDILRRVRAAKVRHKWLAEVEFIDAVPKSPTGKILRKVLRARERERDRREPGVVVVRADEAPAAKL